MQDKNKGNWVIKWGKLEEVKGNIRNEIGGRGKKGNKKI